MSSKSYNILEDNVIALYSRIKNKSLDLNVVMNYVESIKDLTKAIINGEYNPSDQGICAILMLALDQYAYGNGEVIMPDRMYDELHSIYMKRGHSQIIYPDVFQTQWSMAKHNAPWMVGSVAKVYRFQDMTDFIYQESAKHGMHVEDMTWVVAPKFDGISACLEIRNHSLVQALTRGTRVEGQDITAVVSRAQNLPQLLNELDTGFLKVELCVPQSNFEFLKKRGYKNRRSATSAIVNTPKNIDLAQYIHAVPLVFVEVIGDHRNVIYNPPTSRKMTHCFADDLIQEMQELIVFLKDPQYEYDYRTDGVILYTQPVKEDFDDIMESSMAFKINTAEAFTKVKRVYLTVGRTGKITPNAILDPVQLMGSTISRATLHNEDYVISKGLMIHDTVSIRKAGDVIPEVVEAKTERRTGEEIPFKMITNCPICNTKLIKIEDQVDYFCPNPNCPARHIESFIHFVSRPAMNIDGLGDRLMEDLYNFKFISTIPDIYKLKDKKDALTKLEGYGEKSVTNLLNAIEISKSNSLERLLFALGIKNVGKEKAKILAKTYKNMDNLSRATYDELVEIPDIGPIISKNIVDYFNNIDNLKMIEELKELGLNMNYIGEELNVKEDFQDKSFVLTGTLTKLTRDEAKALIENAGGKTVGSVSKKTYAVIVGASPGSKYEKAKELNIPIWTEEEFLEKINS